MADLSLEGVTKVYRKGSLELRALAGVDLKVDKGEFLAVVGPSGSGKTTLLNIIGCLDAPTSGKVVYAGRELSGRNEDGLSAYRRELVGFVFQSFNLIPVLTVEENVELPLAIAGKLSKKEMRERSGALLESVGLGGMGGRYPRELSGGQEQRVAVARALSKTPLVVLADEPTANLDSHTAAELMALMRSINETTGATFIFSTHDARVMSQAKRVVEVRDGAIVSDTGAAP